jgi:hypothetical protein
MMYWIQDRLKERSTWLGIVSFLTAAGVTFGPDQAEVIVSAGLAVAGVVAAFTRD